jgi:predicted nucleic acid-binding protein
VLVCIDATVLCGALRRPTGPNFRLLELAADGTIIGGFTTEVVGFEFVRNALDGIGGVRYDIADVEQFLDAFEPLFDPENIASSPIGRSLTSQTWLHNRPIGEVVYELTGRTRDDLLQGLPEQLRVMSGELDPDDVHLVAAAVERDADVICTANRHHLPEGRLAGTLEVIGPGRLAAELGLV